MKQASTNMRYVIYAAAIIFLSMLQLGYRKNTPNKKIMAE